MSIQLDDKITAIIPVRKGSTRCKNKNIRSFGNTSLLKLKIETLKKVKGIHEIIVSSNCDKMLGIAKNMGVTSFKREDKFCTNENPGNFFCNLANTVKTKYMMHTPVTSPFINSEMYNKMIEIWIGVKDKHDSFNSTSSIKEFIWFDNNSVNYDRLNPPPSQDLPDYRYINFGCNIISVDNVKKYNNIIGNNPYLHNINSVSGMDIDESYEFLISELLYKNNVYNNDICKLILDKRKENYKLIDCTIRDGGYLNNWDFTDNEIVDCYRAVTEAGYDYFEIGFKTNRELLKNKGKWCYSTEEDINKISHIYKGCKIAVMAKIGTVGIEDFVEKSKSNISMVRVLLARASSDNLGILRSRYSKKDLIEAKELCDSLINLGYEVCMNLGCGDLIDSEEIKLIANIFHDVDLTALYLADTYGGFNSDNIQIQLNRFYEEFHKYESTMEFGIHIHNNNGDALEKAKIALFNSCTFIDTTIAGLGRGAGNLKTEDFLCYKYSNEIKKLKRMIKPVIKYYNDYILSKKEYHEKKIQHHPYYCLSGVLSLHPDYIRDILKNEKTNVECDIDKIFKLNEYTKKNNLRNYDKNLIPNVEYLF